jgi:hypothetical protein
VAGGALAQPGAHLGGREVRAVDRVAGGLALGDRPQPGQGLGQVALGLLEPVGEPLDPPGLGGLVQCGRPVGQLAGGELELHQLVGRPAEHGEAERLDGLGQAVAEHPQRVLLLRDDEHAPAVGHEVADQVADRVRLAGAGRPLDGDAAVLGEAACDGLLGLVRRQGHEQPLPDPRPLPRVVAGHPQPARLVGHDRGERADRRRVAREQPVAQPLQEAAELALPGPDEQDARVDDVRAGGGVAGGDDDPVVAEPGEQPLVELPAVGLRPQVDLQRPGGPGDGEQLGEAALVQAGERVGLQARRPGRGDGHERAVGLVLDHDGRRDQRVAHPLAGDGRVEDAVAPDQLGRGGLHVERVHEVEQLAVQRARPVRLGDGARPRPPRPVPPGRELGVGVGVGPARGGGVGGGRKVLLVEAAAQVGGDGDGPDGVGQPDAQPAGVVRARAHLARRVLGQRVHPVRAGRYGARRPFELRAHGEQVVGHGDGAVPDAGGRLAGLAGRLGHSSQVSRPLRRFPPPGTAGNRWLPLLWPGRSSRAEEAMYQDQQPQWQTWAAPAAEQPPRFDAADPLVSTDLAGWWRRGFALLRRAWRPVAVVQAVVAVPILAIMIPTMIDYEAKQAAVRAALARPPASGGPGLGSLFAPTVGLLGGSLPAGLIQLFGIMTSAQLLVMVATGRPAAVGAAAWAALRRFPAALGWSAVAALILLVAVVLCVVPVLYAAAALAVLPVVVLLERGPAISRCFRLFHADAGASLGRIATLAGLAVGASVVVRLLSAGAQAALGGPGTTYATVAAVLGVAYHAAAALVLTPLLLVTYADMRARLEPFTTASLRP